MQHVLRAITGPLAGAVYVLGPRTTIGRASDCEIQILHEGVSRHHAKITLEDDETLTLTDLSSDNGTFIEETRVERHVLLSGEVIRVMRSRFTYEILPTNDAVTSAVFRRKVTSGDSLRQTLDHSKSLSAIRASVAQGLPGGLAGGERGRPYSRPQAAAPALSGARPGAAASGSFGGVSQGAPDEPPAVDDVPSVRRPTPVAAPRLDDSAAFVRDRWPQVARAATPPHDSRAAASPGPLVAGPRKRATHSMIPRAESRSGGVHDEPSADLPPTASTSAHGWHGEAGQGHRERVTLVPTSIARAATDSRPVGAREERPPAPLPPGGPSGRMAPPASGRMSSTTAPSLGGGWVRVPRPLETPGSMRPGSTLSGVPCIALDHDSDRAKPVGPSPVRPVAEGPPARKGRTAEYGALGGPEAEPPASSVVEPELDSMTTVPSVRRVVSAGGSSTPTEEVPRIRDEPPAVAKPADDDEPYFKTVPRVTVVPREPVDDSPSPLLGETSQPELHVAAAPIAPVGSIGYEDTLRFQRAETVEPEARTKAPRAPVTAEIISALEALLPPEDDAEHDLPPTGLRQDAQTREIDPSTAVVDPLLDLTSAAAGLGDDVPEDLSEIDRIELLAQQVLEQADVTHKRRDGLERLVDILEYRELRLLALRGGALELGTAAAQRCAQLEEMLQQRPPAGDDMAAMRRYHRFSCSVPAQVTHRTRGVVSTTSVEIEDISAGGAKVMFGEYSIDAGDTVWLSVELELADRSRIPQPGAKVVVLKARVVWAQPHAARVGLVFAGAPAYDVDPTGS